VEKESGFCLQLKFFTNSVAWVGRRKGLELTKATKPLPMPRWRCSANSQPQCTGCAPGMYLPLSFVEKEPSYVFWDHSAMCIKLW